MAPLPALWTLAWAEQNKFPLFWTPLCGSTQSIAYEDFPRENVSAKIYLTQEQTLGRGRKKDRRWESSGECIQFLATWCFKVERVSHLLSMRLGLNLYQALLLFSRDVDFSLKAPNDLFLGDKKIAGLLTDVIHQGDSTFVLIGLGINVSGKPPIDEAGTVFTEVDEDSLNETEWNLFLDRWLNLVTKTLSNHEPLNANEKAELIDALNRNPLLKDRINDIDNEGSLITAQGAISWRSL